MTEDQKAEKVFSALSGQAVCTVCKELSCLSSQDKGPSQTIWNLYSPIHKMCLQCWREREPDTHVLAFLNGFGYPAHS